MVSYALDLLVIVTRISNIRTFNAIYAPLIYNRCLDKLSFRDIDSSVLSLTVKNLDSTSLKENISLTFQRKNVCCLFYVNVLKFVLMISKQ